MCAASRLPAPFALLALSARRYSAALSWPLLVALFGTADMLKGIVPVADPCAPSHGQSTGVTTIKSRRHLGYLVLEDLEMARWKWFGHDRRIQFEALLRAGHSKQEIAQLLCPRAIWIEHGAVQGLGPLARVAAARRAARTSSEAVTKYLNGVSGKTTVPMSRPSMTTGSWRL